jgi:hypothetical protein
MCDVTRSPDEQDYPAWSVKLAEVSRPWLIRIRTMPRGILLIIVMALLVGGLFLPGIQGGILVAIIGLFVLWLALLAWPAVGPGGRVIRIAVAAVVLGYALWKMVAGF